jgi:hypothetical protein
MVVRRMQQQQLLLLPLWLLLWRLRLLHSKLQ